MGRVQKANPVGGGLEASIRARAHQAAHVTIVKLVISTHFALILAVLTPPAASITVPNQKMVMTNPPHA